MAKFYPYVIVGGGVSAVCCTQELIACDDSEKRIALISAGTLLKVVTNKIPIGQLLQSFDISEESAFQTFTDENRVVFIRGKVIGWKWREKIIRLDDGQEIAYEKLCICTGGRPKNQPSHPLVVSLRDTATIEELDKKVHSARRVVVIGNGGIATEVVYELKNVEIIWAIRHSSISATFFDEGAAEFFKPMLLYGQTKKEESVAPKRFKITVNEDGSRDDTASFALGPDWASYCDITGCLQKRSVHVIYEVEMKEILDSSTEIIPTVKSSYFEGNWPLFVKLSDEQVVGCDLLIHATGVDPNSALWKSECSELELADDNGILVDEHMMTSIPDVYACGDVCSAGWQWSKHWMQMRLWTQAYQMGAYCGRCMAIPDVSLDFCFELFTHVTKFFGYKVIFLGKFNGIGIEKPWHVLMRISKGSEYIKLIVKDGRVQGAVLIGKTDLEETIENLILNQIDITDVEDGLLDPNIVTKEKAAPLIDEWTAKMALRALFTNTQVDSGLPTTSQMFDIQSTEADTTTVTDHTSTVANTKVVGSSEDTGCCSTNEVKNAINDNMPVSEVDLTPDKASHDLAVNNILQNCQSDITPFSLPEGFCRTNSQLPNEASLSTAARTFKPLKCPECQSNVRLVNKYRLDKLWKVECRNIACLKQIALVPYDKDYAEQLKTLYERYLKGVSYCHRKEKCKSKVGNKENKKSGIHKNTLDEVFDEETDENGNVYLWCPGQEEKVILF